MNDIDLNTLKSFADLCVRYFAEDAEYGNTGMWGCLENALQLRKRIDKLIPLINGILRL